MLNLEKIRRSIQDFKARQEEIEDYNKEIEENLDILARDNDEYKARHEDVLKNGSKNPIKNQRARDESVVLGLDDRGQELNEISDEVDDLEKNLKSEIDNFVTKTQEEIKKEKSRIGEAFSRRLNNPETINSLKDEKRKLEEDLKYVQGLIELHESRNVKQTDSIYQNLKRRAQADQEKIDEVNKNLDPELDEQSDDRLSDLWDEFDKYEKDLEKIKDNNNIGDMIKILDSTFPKINQPNQSQPDKQQPRADQPNQSQPAQKQEHEEELDKKSEEQVIDENAQGNTEKGQETSETMDTDSYYESAELVVEDENEQKHYEELAAQLEEQAKREKEEEHEEEEHEEEEHEEEEHDEEEYWGADLDEEEHGEEYDDEEIFDGEYEEYEEQKEEKKGFFKRIFDKIKEIIKKVVTTVKNGFAKLTSKEVKALESAKEKIEEQDEIVPEELEEQAEELEAQVEELDGLRAEVNVRDDKEVMDRIKATEDKFRQEGEENPQRMDLEQPDKSDMEGPEL